MKDTARGFAAATALLAVLAVPGFAEDLSGRLGVGGIVGLAGPLGSRAFSEKNSAGADLGAWLRYGVNRRLTVGGAWENIDFSRGTGLLRPLQGIAAYQLAPSSPWNPNVHAGLGLAHVRGTGPRELSTLGGSVGLGVDAFVWRDLSLGASADWLWAARRQSSSREVNALRAVLNLGWWFGGHPAPKVVAAAPAPSDADRDGIWDSADACPGTPAGTAVDSSGCPLDSDRDGVWDSKDSCPGSPAGTAVNPSGCPLDSDRDGVWDSKDSCPGTPAGTAVDPSGCPLDSDRDGVWDSKDSCPGTPAGVSVDGAGCPLDADADGVWDSRDRCAGTPAGSLVDLEGCPRPDKVSIELKVRFDTGKADIKPEFDEQLQKVADFLKSYPKTIVEIEGHTDNVGSEESNVALSQRRAEAVMAALRDRFGADASKMSAKGYGSSRPVGDNETPEGRASNRRVLATMTAEGR